MVIAGPASDLAGSFKDYATRQDIVAPVGALERRIIM